jgi:ABC-type phosphate transport system auxiliary subunit
MLQNFNLVRDRIAAEKARLEKKNAQITKKLGMLDADSAAGLDAEHIAAETARLEKKAAQIAQKLQELEQDLGRVNAEEAKRTAQ